MQRVYAQILVHYNRADFKTLAILYWNRSKIQNMKFLSRKILERVTNYQMPTNTTFISTQLLYTGSKRNQIENSSLKLQEATRLKLISQLETYMVVVG